MSKDREKPQGASGQISVGAAGVEWQRIEFPAQKAERERLIADLFVKAFDHFVLAQSEPLLAPFGAPKQNAENDLDFTVTTADGEKLMELAEFAPLQEHGPKFENAPNAIDPREKAPLALRLIELKSAHQGGAGRFLVLYSTEHAFKLTDPLTVEFLRRSLSASPPKFDRVYFLSVHNLGEGSVTELYPGKPHPYFGRLPNEKLKHIRMQAPHPREMAAIARSQESSDPGSSPG